MVESELVGKQAQARQQAMASQMRKNPNLINQRLNQMDPRLLQQMGGREAVEGCQEWVCQKWACLLYLVVVVVCPKCLLEWIWKH
jgi:hypothetical protein